MNGTATLVACLLASLPASQPVPRARASAATQAAPQDARTSAPAAIPDATFVDAAPKDAKPVAEVKKSARKGDRVTVAAKIGGRAEPFVRNRAMFVVADRGLRSCDELPGDTCAKPWDYCCETPESLKANTITVVIAGADGKPLKVPAQGVRGLEPLALVVIEGKVVERDDKGVFVIAAERIHVEPAKGRESAKGVEQGAAEAGAKDKDKDKGKDKEKGKGEDTDKDNGKDAK